MLNRLFNWLFAKEDDVSNEVQVFDFTDRGPGNDITLRVAGDGEYAEAVIFRSLGDEHPSIGDFIVVDLSSEDDFDSNIYTFVVDEVTPVSVGVFKVILSRYEGEANE